ncbi:hypothetical protein RIF25_07945 [Thermosynechococcaceae cyanobacterium BACA0444]|uniref:Uncharacterized protein n=1 Tax=Pseudocalidococcus azoricus BACA0444 TaxID=2918990 RepID=A0AAE4JY88_9CYAN|nr:hypothetical protein [Pseudocalidococcus azoricus]MDS3860744.1 hypothetical protein [Pseudocalidococcus azoricus BACA0444]
MFVTELSPLAQELTQKPVAFLGGFVSGLLGLSLSEEPVSQWLAKQGATSTSTPSSTPKNSASGPQSISID